MACSSAAPTPIVLMHGYDASAPVMEPVRQAILAWNPRIHVVNVEVGDGRFDSVFLNMTASIRDFAANVSGDPLLAGGFNLIAHSQGNVISRGYMQLFNSPPVRNYISLAGPHGGFYALTGNTEVDRYLCDWPYSGWVQDHVGPSNYYRDPFSLPLYREKALMAQLNCEDGRPCDAAFRERLLSLTSMHLFGSTIDGFLKPLWTTLFAQYVEGSEHVTVNLTANPVLWEQDVLGLRQLSADGRLVEHVVTDVKHPEFSHRWVADKYVVPLLKTMY